MSVSAAVVRSPLRARPSTRGTGVPVLLLFVATCSWGVSGTAVSAEAGAASFVDEVTVTDRNGDSMVFRLSADGSRVQLFVDGVLDVDDVEYALQLYGSWGLVRQVPLFFVGDDSQTKMDELTALLARVMTVEQAQITAEKVAGKACTAADKKVSIFARLTNTLMIVHQRVFNLPRITPSYQRPVLPFFPAAAMSRA
jgi:hypothetical protein